MSIIVITIALLKETSNTNGNHTSAKTKKLLLTQQKLNIVKMVTRHSLLIQMFVNQLMKVQQHQHQLSTKLSVVDQQLHKLFQVRKMLLSNLMQMFGMVISSQVMFNLV